MISMKLQWYIYYTFVVSIVYTYVRFVVCLITASLDTDNWHKTECVHTHTHLHTYTQTHRGHFPSTAFHSISSLHCDLFRTLKEIPWDCASFEFRWNSMNSIRIVDGTPLLGSLSRKTITTNLANQTWFQTRTRSTTKKHDKIAPFSVFMWRWKICWNTLDLVRLPPIVHILLGAFDFKLNWQNNIQLDQKTCFGCFFWIPDNRIVCSIFFTPPATPIRSFSRPQQPKAQRQSYGLPWHNVARWGKKPGTEVDEVLKLEII